MDRRVEKRAGKRRAETREAKRRRVSDLVGGVDTLINTAVSGTPTVHRIAKSLDTITATLNALTSGVDQLKTEVTKVIEVVSRIEQRMDASDVIMFDFFMLFCRVLIFVH